MEQEAINTLSKFKSQNESWFNQSKTKTTNGKEGNIICKDSIYIRQDSLIQIRCKQGNSKSTENTESLLSSRKPTTNGTLLKKRIFFGTTNQLRIKCVY